MDKITKFLQKLSKKDKKIIQAVIEQLYSENTESLDIKKLKGEVNVFRVKKGNIRIIYSLNNSRITIIKIEFRSEVTYE